MIKQTFIVILIALQKSESCHVQIINLPGKYVEEINEELRNLLKREMV